MSATPGKRTGSRFDATQSPRDPLRYNRGCPLPLARHGCSLTERTCAALPGPAPRGATQGGNVRPVRAPIHPMLEAHNLAARRGTSRLFSAVSFRVEAGNALIVTGPNGSGKTTLLRIVAGCTAAEAGEVRWNGTAVAPFDPCLRSVVAFAGHEPALKDELTAEENLESLVALSGEDTPRAEIRNALDAVTLGRQRNLPARVLSQGQRRRIGLARLSLSRRPLWILDEPVTALDTAGTALLAQLIGTHLEQGGVAVAATHTTLGLPDARVHSLALS